MFVINANVSFTRRRDGRNKGSVMVYNLISGEQEFIWAVIISTNIRAKRLNYNVKYVLIHIKIHTNYGTYTFIF